MLQFTSQEMAAIRRRASQDIIEQIIADNQVVLNSETLVPPDARATWNLYYFCPTHGVRLNWDRNKPTEHVCPVDSEVLTGEPYDGAWWRWLNGLNSKACNDLGLLWQITEEKLYLEKVREILLAYAEYYPDYQEHGGIPYNGPGKANAQTLCEANCNIDFARGYDFIKDQLSFDEQAYIEQRLLREGAQFLMQHRADQLHNHEMKISATIGVIGLILNDQSLINFAVNTPYGLKYQLENGVKGEGLWFEGSIHYHYYALQALLNFEKMACKTEHSLQSEPNFHTMLAFPLKLLMNNGDFPRLNDCIAGQEKLTHSHLFEFAYREFNDPLFASALQNIYQRSPRNTIDALLYGVETLPGAEQLQCQSIHAEQSGVTIMHNRQYSNMLLVKHSPYGGEHDHYDRLGLIINRNGKEILPDLGTTGYGAELHYGYYKNTATHNTLAVNQQNQPPANPQVNQFVEANEYTWLDTQTDWCGEQPTVDSHTIVQWDDAAYKDVVFRRQILWLGDVAIEFDTVKNPHQQQLDLIWHIRGEHHTLSQAKSCDNPLDGPLARMTDSHEIPLHESIELSYEIEGQTNFNQQILTDSKATLLLGYAPDNPATSELAYTLLRCKDAMLKTTVVHNLTESDDIRVIGVEWGFDSINFTLLRNGLARSVYINQQTGVVLID
ncbi:heparinase II/III domain-containing protein [Vibrio renipiscarius]|uniref:Alginate lyase n=1 Tax=Vibrio renipiscarius TaxID=1461322 RepID=A0A0C2KFJ5_9VIBR|nr:heparinase II/III family protein [Vibrio renipiscarius]KII79408.1 alginate lyase [Vibrio renipiscarius]KII80963.1 alginate lyase [Vibrio renipiscarius]